LYLELQPDLQALVLRCFQDYQKLPVAQWSLLVRKPLGIRSLQVALSLLLAQRFLMLQRDRENPRLRDRPGNQMLQVRQQDLCLPWDRLILGAQRHRVSRVFQLLQHLQVLRTLQVLQ